MQGITPANLDILRTLGISHRLKARVGALLKKKLSLTPALLETAEPGSELEKFLLAPALLKIEAGLDADSFKDLLSGCSQELQALLAYLPEPGGFDTLMLMDEEIAGDFMEAEQPAAGLPAVAAAGGVIDTERSAPDEALLNDPDSLRMTILTSPDTQAKIEAIRRMLFSEHDVIVKGNLFFAALSDDDNTVRTEALKAMNKIGLDADLADAMQAFCNSPSNMIPVSIKRLAGILKKVTEAEAVIGAKILVSRLKDNVNVESKGAVLTTLSDVIETLVPDVKAVQEIADQVLRVFVREPDKLGTATIGFFEKVLPYKDPELYAHLYSEQFRIDDVRISSVLAALLFPYEEDDGRRIEMVENILANFNEVSGAEESKRTVLSSLGRINHNLVYETIAKNFTQYESDIKIAVMYFLGSALRRERIGDETAGQIVDMLLDILRMEDSKLIIALLETGILANPSLARARKRQIAHELVRLWEVFTIPYLQYALEDTLSTLGTEAVAIMFEYVCDFPDSPVNKHLTPILAENIAAMSGTDEADTKVFKHCIREGLKLFKADSPAKGVLAVMLGRACNSSLITKAMSREIYKLFMDTEDYAKFRTPILEGLGWLGASPKVDLQVKVELAARFQRLLSIKLPDVVGKKVVEENTNVFIMGPEANLYTEFLPVIIQSLTRIGVSVKTGGTLQISILQAILRMWEKTASWEIILGPAASFALVTGLARFGSIPDLAIKTKELILKNLVAWKNQLYVIGAVGEMAAQGNEKYRLSALYTEVIEEILEMLKKENDVYSEKEKMTILGCFAAIINNKRINPKSSRYKRFIDTGSKFLVRGHKEGVRQAYGWLQDMARVEDIPASFRKEIANVLETLHHFALETIKP